MSRYIDEEKVREKLQVEFGVTSGRVGVWIDCLLKSIPTVDVEPVVHGHWECFPGTFAPNGVKGCVICSNCNATVDLDTFSLMDKCGQTKKCGACGAQMDKG